MTTSERSETDHISALELQSNRRMLYFSDGVMEELSSSDSDAEPDVPDKGYDDQLQRELTLVPRLRYKASKMGNHILAGIDYVGGGLASFLGITHSKYASELKYHQRAKEEAEAEAQNDEDLDNNWQTNNNNNADGSTTIVVCEPPAARGGVNNQLAATTNPTSSSSTSMPQ
ncbi:hypothetical protein KR215_011100 [Drosophila sulfurigaster]|uniref:uncharacterized protein LOC133847342 n=1 Tax=Drosophila sulfurigaster albostrigata TaxID=89887 RepID=UPI002D21A08A|nr:uncharacterized protein LOC133847342 [Drosophila sulfurigaster albostrigata]KAH8400380.1 hypothetical protein KR215_011100 [Drosophila sulfurigaster]